MINYVDYWPHGVLKFLGALIFIPVNPLPFARCLSCKFQNDDLKLTPV